MVKLVPVTMERHAARKWRRPVGFGFAAKEAFVPVVGAELGRAALAMPLGFSKREDHYVLGAVSSFAPGRNLFVAADGRWLARYAPAWLRIYPFWLTAQKDSAELVLNVDEDSGLVVDGNSNAEPFFDSEGKLSPSLANVVGLLQQFRSSMIATQRAVAALAEADVIKPWKIKLRVEGKDELFGGLNHVDEASLAKLSNERFLKLRETTALPIAYAQLLSENRLEVLPLVAKMQETAQPASTSKLPENLDALFEPAQAGNLIFK